MTGANSNYYIILQCSGIIKGSLQQRVSGLQSVCGVMIIKDIVSNAPGDWQMKFDTNDKKPALYNVLVLTVITVIYFIVMYLREDSNVKLSSVVLVAYFIIVEILLLTALVKQLQYNPYSYNSIYYSGFALFILFVLAIELSLTVKIFQHPDQYRINDLISWMEVSARSFMILSFPFVLAFSLLMVVSNISLIRHEGKRIVNALGIAFGFLFSGGVVLLFFLDSIVTDNPKDILLHQMFINLYATVYLYLECMLIGTIIASLIVVRYYPERDKDYMIILGCGLRKDGTPTPLLKGRINAALSFYRRQREENGKELIFVASGGQGRDEVIPEGLSIKQYLMEQGIKETQIIVEDRSTSTFENMKFSRKMIESRGPITKETRIAFATTNYHVFRSGLFARRVKMRALGIGAKTVWYFWPNAWVREFVGLLTEHRGKQFLTIGGMIALFAVLTMALYR